MRDASGMRRDGFDGPVLSGGRRRRRSRRWLAGPVLAVTVVAFFALGLERTDETADEPAAELAGTAAASGSITPPSADQAGARRANRFKLKRVEAPLPVRRDFKRPPRAGILFDVDTGEVLWERHPRRELPIASLTKMMTALVIARGHRPGELVRISKRAVRTTGSKVGILPKGKRLELDALLHGLLLVSGNDTAVALAEHDAGSVPRFVTRMNREAKRRRLACTRFSSPHGLADRGNRSCPRDLAAMARAILADRRLARIVGTDRASFELPGDSSLDLYNNNPLMRMGRPGITGVKTGLTAAAGRCYVTTAKRDGRHLGVVLLHSPDPIEQIDKLLAAGLKTKRKA
jgi:serine-type D-Ala-D-Ala carboxypeptidase (penicillin-binding protein 5/6)